MCIIYQRQPKVDIDFDKKFKPSVINNPHGYGVSIVEGDGVLTTFKDLTDEPDPDTLYKLIQEELFDQQVMFHLRYTTAGDTTIRNLHPFPVLEHDKDGVDLRMAHNGTIHKFKHTANSDRSWESDTRNFVRTYVRPLFKLLIKGNGIEDLLTDPLVFGLLNEHLPNASVLSFIDGFGNTLEVNATGNGGKYEDEGKLWYSNTYSFNEDHRTPRTYNHGYGGHNQEYRAGPDGKWGWFPRENNNTSPPSGTKTSTGSQHGERAEQFSSSRVYSEKDHAMDTKTTPFSEKYKDVVDNIEDLFSLSDETLEFLQENEPQDMLLLVKELMMRCYGLNEAVSKKTKEIKALQAKETADGKAA